MWDPAGRQWKSHSLSYQKLEEISGEDKLTLNSRMEKIWISIFFMVEYTGCMLIWSTRVVVPSHPTAAQEQTLETLFCGYAVPGYHREQVGTDLRGMCQKSKRTALERERQMAFTSSCSYRIFAAGRFQQDPKVRSQGQGAGHEQRNHRPWRYVRRDRFYRAAREAGIKPILGCEVYVAPNSRFDKELTGGEERYHHLVLRGEKSPAMRI